MIAALRQEGVLRPIRWGWSVGEDVEKEALSYERTYVSMALEIAERDMGMTRSAFAHKALFGRKDPYRTLLHMLSESKKPQRITLSEAYLMAKAIGQDFHMFSYLVRAKILAQQERQTV